VLEVVDGESIKTLAKQGEQLALELTPPARPGLHTNSAGVASGR